MAVLPLMAEIPAESDRSPRPLLVRTLSTEQIRRLASVHISTGRGLMADAPRDLIRRIADVFAVKVVLVAKQADRWTILTEAPLEPTFDITTLEHCVELESLAARDSVDVVAFRRDDRAWTLVGLTHRAGLAAVLVLEDDWTAGSSAALMQLAANLLFAERTFTLATDARVRLASHKLARRLARTRGTAQIGKIIVTAIGRTLGVRTVSLAVPDPYDKTLRIVATHGYPLELVSGARISVGEGVLGRVYETRTPLRVPDITVGSQGVRRTRYGSTSAMVLPIVAGAQVLGILSVTDRHDTRPFTAEDMSRLRTLAAPVALALQRERAALSAEAFAHAASVDAASGLFNRRHLTARLEEELQRARRHNTDLALIMLDIDDFKAINDRFGHLVGDAVLRDTAEIIRSSVRVFDVCARYGGEEFAILMPGAGTQVAVNTAERIRARMAQHRAPQVEDQQITISVGVASIRRDMSGQDLIAAADRALYMAKRQGKNQVHTMPDAD
jgi:diguanylate cyclase (GGDEF)-like protein